MKCRKEEQARSPGDELSARVMAEAGKCVERAVLYENCKILVSWVERRCVVAPIWLDQS